MKELRLGKELSIYHSMSSQRLCFMVGLDDIPL
jgi:hypothetical protein